MVTRFENYTTGDDGYQLVNEVGGLWGAQTFTPSISHALTSIKLKLDRFGADITGNISVTLTEVGVHPNDPGTFPGSDWPRYPSDTLAFSDSFNSSDVTVGVPIWCEFNFSGGGRVLLPNTTYAIVLRVPSGGTGNGMVWRADTTSPTYARGFAFDGFGDIGRWFKRSGEDYMFEDWGFYYAVTTQQATLVTSTSATLNGYLNADGNEACTCGFDYGETTAYGTSVNADGTYTTGQTFLKAISGLVSGTTYHFRAKATNTAGTVYGNDILIGESFFPNDPLTRVTSITHRYDRGVYSMELGLGDVVSDFGIPEVDSEVKKSYTPKEERVEELPFAPLVEESAKDLSFLAKLIWYLDILGITRLRR